MLPKAKQTIKLITLKIPPSGVEATEKAHLN
jgi:hypothetical protein